MRLNPGDVMMFHKLILFHKYLIVVTESFFHHYNLVETTLINLYDLCIFVVIFGFFDDKHLQR